MKRFKFVAIICGLALMALAIAPRVNAQTSNEKTVITFSEPFEVPGVDPQILPAGTYAFTLVDSLSDRNIVRITNVEGTHVYTTILAINNYRLKPRDKTVLTFKERGEGQPEAIKAWFYPGYAFGQEFVYSKKRAIELAKIADEPVLAIPVEVTPEHVEVLKSVKLEAIKPTGEEVPVTAVVQAPPVAVVAKAEPQAAPETLPHTASSLPLYASIGLLSLLAGFTLLIVSKRAA